MKVIHIVNLLLILFLLVGICVAEEIVVSRSLQDVQDRCLYIEQILERDDTLKTTEMALAIDNLEYNWQDDEGKLCYMVNHKNIQEIGQEIAKIKQYIASDDIDAFRVSIETIKSYCKSYMHFMGANFHNVL